MVPHILSKLCPHRKFLFPIQHLVKRTEYDTQPPCLVKILVLHNIGINPFITNERMKHVVILLFNSKVEWCLSSLVFDVEVEDLAARGGVYPDHVFDCLILLFAEGDVDWSRIYLIN